MRREDKFTRFVRWFGGEVIEDLLPRSAVFPKNADYLLFARSVVAELKSLEKDYFHDQGVGEKLRGLANSWVREGILRREQVVAGRFSLRTLPERCSLQTMEVLGKPLREALTSANNQIKASKAFFDVPRASGLLIVRNDGNFTLDPEFTLYVLGRLCRNRFSAIESFIYFAPELDVAIPGIAPRARIWLSGSVRGADTGVRSDFLNEMSAAWLQFLSSESGDPLEPVYVKDKRLLRSTTFRKDTAP